MDEENRGEFDIEQGEKQKYTDLLQIRTPNSPETSTKYKSFHTIPNQINQIRLDRGNKLIILNFKF